MLAYIFIYFSVIANNAGIRKYLASHPPLRIDGIHPYIQCRRRCIYGIVPHPVPVAQDVLFDIASLSRKQDRTKLIRPTQSRLISTSPVRKSPATDSETERRKTLTLDEDQYCSVFSTEDFPLVGDSSKKGVFEYWKNYNYDEEVSAQMELNQAWHQVSCLEQQIGARQEAELEASLQMEDGQTLHTNLRSPVFYPWDWQWKPDIHSKTPVYSRRVLLKFDSSEIEKLINRISESSKSN